MSLHVTAIAAHFPPIQNEKSLSDGQKVIALAVSIITAAKATADQIDGQVTIIVHVPKKYQHLLEPRMKRSLLTGTIKYQLKKTDDSPRLKLQRIGNKQPIVRFSAQKKATPTRKDGGG